MTVSVNRPSAQSGMAPEPCPLTIIAVSNMIGDIFDCALESGWDVVRIVLNQPEVVRDRTAGLATRLPMLSKMPEVIDLNDFQPPPGTDCFIGTTSPRRSHLVADLNARFQLRYISLIHPSAHISRFATIGEGVFINAGAVVGPNTNIGAHTFVNRGVTIGHDTRVGAFCRLQPGSHIAGHVHIGESVTIGMGACITEERVIGARSIIHAGAIVGRDIPADSTVTGVRTLAKATTE